MSKKFKRAFAPNLSPHYDTEAAESIADELIYVCPSPIFARMKDDHRSMAMFRRFVETGLTDFDPENDVVLDFGDPWIFALMIYYLSDQEIEVGRYDKRKREYDTMRINFWWDAEDAD